MKKINAFFEKLKKKIPYNLTEIIVVGLLVNGIWLLMLKLGSSVVALLFNI